MAYEYACALVAIVCCAVGIAFGYVVVEAMTEAIATTLEVLSVTVDGH